LAYGNIQAGPWEWLADPAVRSFLERLRDAGDDRLGVQIAFDVLGDPDFSERAAFEVARELGIPVTTHAGVWGATSDTGIQQMSEHMTAHLQGDTITRLRLRAKDVVEWCTRGGAHTIGRDADLGSLEVGKKADVVLIKNENSPVSFPLLNPFGHVAFQAQRGD